MRSLFIFLIIIFVSCRQNSPADRKVKVAAVHMEQSSHNATANRDSIEIEEQNRHGEWMVRTFYSLKQMGLNYKKSWIYIDSATKSIYKDSIPHWYGMLKQQTANSMRDKKRYKRTPIM
jgi:hypothetical protein